MSGNNKVPPPPSALPDFSALGVGRSPIVPPVPPSLNPFAPRNPSASSLSSQGSKPTVPSHLPDISSLPKPAALPNPVDLPKPPFINTRASPAPIGKSAELAKSTTVLSPLAPPTQGTPPQIDVEFQPSVNSKPPDTTPANQTEVPTTPPPHASAPLESKTALNVQNKPVESLSLALKSVEQDLDNLEHGDSMFGWLSKTVAESKFLSQVAEKAKVGMETVLTTLDPGMKDFLSGEGVVELYVGTEDPTVISAVRQGFERVFSQVVARGVPVSQADLPPLCMSASQSFALCAKRATRLAASRLASPSSPFVVLQSFVLLLENEWYSCTALLLRWKGVDVTAITQPLIIEQRVKEYLQMRASNEGSSDDSFSINVSQAAREVYGEDESWASSALPHGFSEFLTPASAVLAADFRRIAKELKEKQNSS